MILNDDVRLNLHCRLTEAPNSPRCARIRENVQKFTRLRFKAVVGGQLFTLDLLQGKDRQRMDLNIVFISLIWETEEEKRKKNRKRGAWFNNLYKKRKPFGQYKSVCRDLHFVDG